MAKGRKPSLKWKNRYLEEQIHWVPLSMSIYFIGWRRRSISNMICCTFCMVQLSMFLRLVLSPVVFSNLYFLCRVSTRHLDSCPPRDMILWVLEFNDEGVIFMQSFSVSVHPDEQRRNSRDGYNSFAEFSMST